MQSYFYVLKRSRVVKKTTLGVIVGNRAFFPDKFVEEGRKEILQVLNRWAVETVILERGRVRGTCAC